MSVHYPYRGKGLEGLKKQIDAYDQAFLLSRLEGMLKIRLVEEKIIQHYYEDQMKTPVHLAIGQEAVSEGVCSALSKTDWVYCSHRTHGVYIAKGGDLNAMFSEFFCRANGCCGSRGGSMHLLDKSVGMMGSSAIVGGIVPIATGAALAAKMQKTNRVIVVFIGDATVEEGVVWESINFAVLKKLPIIFVCENNYYSVCSPLDYRQAKGVEIVDKAKGFGLKALSIDGNDVLTVHKTTAALLDDVRSGKGPAFIEAHTYRHMAHHGSEVDFGYRDEDELAVWKTADPIVMLETALSEVGQLNQADYDEKRSEIKESIASAFRFGETSSDPKLDDLLKHVYAD